MLTYILNVFTSHIGKLLARIETELDSFFAKSLSIVAPLTHTSLSFLA